MLLIFVVITESTETEYTIVILANGKGSGMRKETKRIKDMRLKTKITHSIGKK